MRYETIAADKINLRDEKFRTSYFDSLESLIPSIRKVGLVSPPLLREGKKGFVVVTGWKRILACRSLRLSPLHVLVTENKNDLDLLLAAVYENLACRTIGLVEKSIMVRKLKEFGEDQTSLLRTHFPALSLPATFAALDLVLALSAVEEEVKAFVQEKDMPLSLVQNLLLFKPEERKLLLPLLRPLGQNKQKEVLEDLYEISRRDGVSTEDILRGREVQRMLRLEKPSSLQKSERLRAILREKRFPRWTAALASFSSALKKMRWPKQIVIQPSPYFEDENLFVSFRFKNIAEFRVCASLLLEMAESQHLADLFKAGRETQRA